MTIDLYQSSLSPPCRAVRMVAKQLKIDLNLKLVDMKNGEHRKPEFLKINPAHCVPTIVDNGFALWESRAIIQYLCNKYAPDSDLYPKDPKDRANVDRMLNFDMTLYKSIFNVIFVKAFFGVEPTETDIAGLKNNLKLLDTLIGDNGCVASNKLTIADLAVVISVTVLKDFDYDLSEYSNVKQWFDRLKNDLSYFDEINGSVKEEFRSFINRVTKDNARKSGFFKDCSMTQAFDFNVAYPTLRPTMIGANAISASQPLAAQVGMRMLMLGGNAVDAAVATAMALTVLEPTGNGIGSDAFAIVWDSQQLHGLNASGRSPAAWNAEYFAGRSAMPELGWDSVTVPGAVSAWVELAKRFGSLPLTTLAQPAIDYARNGFPVSPLIAHLWASDVKRLHDQPGFSACFAPEGRAPKVGEIFRNTDQARSLELIAQTGGEAFYRGELAEKIAAFSAKCGAALTLEDLANHKVNWVDTLSQSFAGGTVHELPPNGQGIATLIALGILEKLNIGQHPADSVNTLHLSIEAMKLALADLDRHISDADTMHFDVQHLLSDEYLQQRADLIDPTQAKDVTYGSPHPGGTVYLTTANASGMMVSFIQSNYMGFGSGVVIPGSGISMQNRGNGFSLDPEHANCVAPNKRPMHTIIPAFALDADGRPLMSFGCMGGQMQAQGHLQLALRVMLYGQNPQAAIDAPRWRVIQGRKVAVESTMDHNTLAALRAMGHQIQMEDPRQCYTFGGAQVIVRHPQGHYLAGSESRKDGQALVM